MTTIEDLLKEIKAIPAETTEYDLWKPHLVYDGDKPIQNESMVAALLTMKMISKGLYSYARIDEQDGATIRYSTDINKKPQSHERSTRV